MSSFTAQLHFHLPDLQFVETKLFDLELQSHNAALQKCVEKKQFIILKMKEFSFLYKASGVKTLN